MGNESNILEGLNLGDNDAINLDDSELSDFSIDTSNLTDLELLDIHNEDVKPPTKTKVKKEETPEDIERELAASVQKQEVLQPKEEEVDIDVIDTFNSLFSSLEEKGLVSKVPEDWSIETEEDIAERFQYEGKVIASNYLEKLFSNYGDQNRKFVEDIVLKGLDPFEYLSEAKVINDFSNIDLEDEEVLKNVYLQYETQVLGTSPDKAKRNLKRIVDSGDLEEEGAEAHKELLKLKNQELENMASEKERKKESAVLVKEEAKKEVLDFINLANSKQTLNGVKVSGQELQDLFNYATEDRYSLDGQLITEFDKDLLELRKPENIEQRVFLMYLLKNKFNIDRVALEKENRETKGLFESLKKKNRSKGFSDKGTNAEKLLLNL